MWGAAAARQRSTSKGAHSAPATPSSACGCTPTGVASTGTSHASASNAASPNPSASEGTTTALAAFTHSGTCSGATPPRVCSCTDPRRGGFLSPPVAGGAAPCAELSARERHRAVVALAGACGVRREQQAGGMRVQTQLGAGARARDRVEALHVHAARQHLHLPPPRRARGQLEGELRGGGGNQVHQREHRTGGHTGAGVAHVGAVHGQPSDPRARRKRRPGGEAEMGMHHVQALRVLRAPAVPGVQPASGLEQCGGAGRELVQLDLHLGQPAQRIHLVAHETAPLGVAGVGKHVGHDQRSHDPRR